ncbi:hypothetical protein QIS74_04607 [Colletotrichum tabaci]|uniref:Uncharacterized protein n=1 Tax=Colletotrichum tabaci TaxID=1209068 RepID=A0AAV9TK47_9PEZI
MTYFHLLLWLVIFSWSSTAQLRRRDPGLTEYIIYPKEEAAKGDLDVFHQTLEKLAGISKIETIIDDGGDSPFSWRASLTSEQLNEVENHPVVFATQVNKPTVFNPDPELDTNLRHNSIKPSRAKRATVSRTPTADNDMLDLRMASTPPGQDLVKNYVSEGSAGAGITVYILEFDAVMFHKELFPPYSSVTRRQIDADESLLTNERRKKSLTQHGTCVATKVAGKTTGPASQANLVLVRPGLETFSVFKAYESIRDDIKKNRLQGKAIITTSANFLVDIEVKRSDRKAYVIVIKANEEECFNRGHVIKVTGKTIDKDVVKSMEAFDLDERLKGYRTNFGLKQLFNGKQGHVDALTGIIATSKMIQGAPRNTNSSTLRSEKEAHNLKLCLDINTPWLVQMPVCKTDRDFQY